MLTPSSRVGRTARSLRHAVPRLMGRRPGRYLGILALILSPCLAVLFLGSAFGARSTLTAVAHANLPILMLPLGLSVVIQVLRAERARRLLTSEYPVSLGQSYGPMVIGHGLGDLLPLAPSGPALRCVLTKRVAGVPVAFSAGAFVLEGLLDGLGLALLGAYLLVASPLPSSVHTIVVWLLVQTALLFVVLLVAHRLLDRGPQFGRAWWRSGVLTRTRRQIGNGLSALSGAGPGPAVAIVGLSLLITALSGLQIALFLRAFTAPAAPAGLALVVLLTLGMGSLPIKLPGLGTVTAAAALTVAGIHASGASGYLAVSRAVFACQTPILALLVLAWWSLTGYSRQLSIGSLVRQSVGGQAPSAELQPSQLKPARPVQLPPGPIGSAARAITRVAPGTRAVALRWRGYLLVFCSALAMRLAALGLSGGTFDPDEFVLLALGRAVQHGAVPYRDLTYYHPPGMLYLMAALQPLTHWWLPASRVVMLVVDSATAALVWHIGRGLYSRRTATIAGMLYAASPLTIISAVRVGPDPVITALGILGLCQMQRTRGRSGPVLAGIALALAVWTKYPALLFLPVYVLAAPRKAPRMLAAFGVATACLFAPFLPEARALVADTVLWQAGHRGGADLLHRAGSVGGYWLGLNCLGVIGLVRNRPPRWLSVGFCTGGLFLLTAQAYYHYFVPIVPFAALLGAPVIRPVALRSTRLLAAGAIALTLLWSFDIGFGPPPARLFVSASQLSSAQATAAVIDRRTPAHSPILADEFEYALLSHRRDATHYFWNMEGNVSAIGLERQLSHVAAVVQTTGAGRTYPRGFIDYLEDHSVPRVRAGAAIVWILHDRVADGTSSKAEYGEL